MSEWVETTLGEVMDLEVVAVPIDSAYDYAVVGVLNRGRGLLFRDAMSGAATRYKALNRIGPNQIVYSRLKAFEGAITVAPASLGEAYASQEFPTFTCRPSLLPEYFRLLTTTKRLWDDLQNLSTGMGGRRERVKPRDFLTVKIALPSIAEQRRIVDVMAAVDAQIEALAVEITWAGRAAERMRDDLVESLRDEPHRALGDILTIVRGGSPRPIQDFLTDADNGVNWIKIGDIKAGGKYVDGTAERIRPEGKSRSREVHPGDFILSNSMSFGRPYIVRIDGCVHDGWLVLQDDGAAFDQEFLYELLRSAQMQAEFERLAAGSGVRNLKRDSVRTIQVPLPSKSTQSEIARSLSVQHAATESMGGELAHLRKFRSTILNALLSREIEIPESYDDLLEAVS